MIYLYGTILNLFARHVSHPLDGSAVACTARGRCAKHVRQTNVKQYTLVHRGGQLRCRSRRRGRASTRNRFENVRLGRSMKGSMHKTQAQHRCLDVVVFSSVCRPTKPPGCYALNNYTPSCCRAQRCAGRRVRSSIAFDLQRSPSWCFATIRGCRSGKAAVSARRGTTADCHLRRHSTSDTKTSSSNGYVCRNDGFRSGKLLEIGGRGSMKSNVVKSISLQSRRS